MYAFSDRNGTFAPLETTVGPPAFETRSRSRDAICAGSGVGDMRKSALLGGSSQLNATFRLRFVQEAALCAQASRAITINTTDQA